MRDRPRSQPPPYPRRVRPIGVTELALEVRLLARDDRPPDHAEHHRQQQEWPQRVDEQRDAGVEGREPDVHRVAGEAIGAPHHERRGGLNGNRARAGSAKQDDGARRKRNARAGEDPAEQYPSPAHRYGCGLESIQRVPDAEPQRVHDGRRHHHACAIRRSIRHVASCGHSGDSNASGGAKSIAGGFQDEGVHSLALMHPLLILLVGMATILVGIVLLRLNAFLALVIAAIVVSLLAPGEPAAKIARVAEGFGRTAGTVGIVIALAAITGKAMTDSGAADRIVNGFLALLGEKRGATALCSTGYILSIPVFFDTVFYLLVPLARSMYGRTNRNYLKYLLAIAAGAGATHTLVPPTPGPLAIAGTLGVDLGTMVLVGIVVALPAAGAGLLFAGWVDHRMPVVPQRPAALAVGASAVTAPAPQRLPGLVPSILPIILPVLLISSRTVVVSMTARPGLHVTMWSALAPYTAIIGNPNLALLLGTGIAMWVYVRQRTVSRADLAEMVETSLMSAGVMILIIAASGGFGVALQATEIGSVIERAFVGQSGGAASGTDSGMVFLFLGFGVASLIKLAQGSSTVAMITTAAMLAAMLPASGLPFHTVYVATAIASGSLVGTWMNDSGFWLFSKMGGVTEIETLKSWTPVLAIVGTGVHDFRVS